jgi:16S rRNA (adenine1518-N6/adenine1519-N6)-dimethyltransferase
MSDYASLDPSCVTLDIGAGLGFLTRFLASKCQRVLAVEIDRHLVEVLREQLRSLPNVRIIKGNVLKEEIPEFNSIVSIPPYQISTRLITWLFRRSFDCAVLVFQKEFAGRLTASVGSDDYGWLTVLTYYHAGCELLDDVPSKLFYPQPEVGSVIVRLKLKRQQPLTLKDEALFTKLTKQLFTQRNRKVRKAILPFLEDINAEAGEDVVKRADSLPFHEKRVRELAPEDFGVLADALIG